LSRNIRVIFIILSVVLIFFAYNIGRFYLGVSTAPVKDNPETNTVSVLRENLYSFRENGFYGVKDRNGKIIIEAGFNEINQLSSEYFIVSKHTLSGTRYGIIDIRENLVVPFIYKSIINSNNEFAVGITENDKYILFDCCGVPLINEEWDSYSKNYESSPLMVRGNFIRLDKGKSSYRIKYDLDGKLIMTDLYIKKFILGEEKTVTAKNTSSFLRLSDTHRIYNEILDKSLLYAESLFSGDSVTVKSLSWDEDYKEIQLEDMNFRGSELKTIEDISLSVEDDETGNPVYSCSLMALCTSPENIQWDGTYTNSENKAFFEITMKKNHDGSLAISKVKAQKEKITAE